MQTKKPAYRLLSLLMAVMMVVTMIPVSAMAVPAADVSSDRVTADPVTVTEDNLLVRVEADKDTIVTGTNVPVDLYVSIDATAATAAASTTLTIGTQTFDIAVADDKAVTVTAGTGATINLVEAGSGLWGGWVTTTIANLGSGVNDVTVTLGAATATLKIILPVTVKYEGGVTGQLITVPDTAYVGGGDQYTVSSYIPQLEGYEFSHWAVTNATPATVAPGGTITLQNGDVTLQACWNEANVTITYPTVPAGVELTKMVPAAANPDTSTASVKKGSTVAFMLTLDNGYNADMGVTANGMALVSVPFGGSSMYYYSFEAKADTTIEIKAPTAKEYTVTMPAGRFEAKLTEVKDSAGTADNDAIATDKGSATVPHGGTYTFTVAPDDDHKIIRVLVNGAVVTGTEVTTEGVKAGTKSYTVTNVTGPQLVEVVVDDVSNYTVTYSISETGVQYTQQIVADGSTATAPVEPVVEGYNFVKWYTMGEDGAGNAVKNAYDFTAPVTTNLNLYAELTKKEYSVTYIANAGTDTVTGMPEANPAPTKKHGEALQLDNAIPERIGYNFLGWGTVANATAASYQPGDMYSTDANITLCAVWEKKTYTVTLPVAGDGFTLNAKDSVIVEHGSDFEFDVVVDTNYAVGQPVVKSNDVVVTNVTTPTFALGSSSTWSYEISGITENQAVSVTVTRNPKSTVNMYMVPVDNGIVDESILWHTQPGIDYGYPVGKPASDPVLEGYTFEGWYLANGSNPFGTEFDYSNGGQNSITTTTSIYAKMVQNTYTVSFPATAPAGVNWMFTTNNGVEVNTAADQTVVHGATVIFTVTVAKGYTGLPQVGVNGWQLHYDGKVENADGSITYTYVIPKVTEDIKITVNEVYRKTITITYNANSQDDVSGMPEQQVVNYYVQGAQDNGTITTQKPSRVGYAFLGWAVNSESAIPYYANPSIPADENKGQVAYATHFFTKDTTLYAIWEATETKPTLVITDAEVAEVKGEGDVITANAKEFEGQKVTLTLKLPEKPSTGSVVFYQNGSPIHTESANGTETYVFEATISAYDLSKAAEQNVDTFYAVYSANSAEGYASAMTAEVKVDVLPAAIAWEDDNNALVITEDGVVVSGEALIANTTYTLTIPDVVGYTTGAEIDESTLRVEWWSIAPGASARYINGDNKNTITVTPEVSGTKYFAHVYPSDPYTYARQNSKSAEFLTTSESEESVTMPTTTVLTIGNVEEFAEANQQYEGTTITLTADVTAEAANVDSGSVTFVVYEQSDAGNKNNSTISTVKVENGRATTTYTLPAYALTGAANYDNLLHFVAIYNDVKGNSVTFSSSSSANNKTGLNDIMLSDIEAADKVDVKSRAIAWYDRETKLGNEPELTITGTLTAKKASVLTIPDVYGYDPVGNRVALTAGTDYQVYWQWKKDALDSWHTYDKEYDRNSKTVTVTPETSDYQYRAMIVPMKEAGQSVFFTAAEYDENGVKQLAYNALYTAATTTIGKRETKTLLEIHKVEANPGHTQDDDGVPAWEQYEGKLIDLIATVYEKQPDIDQPSDIKVTSGTVTFYKSVNGGEFVELKDGKDLTLSNGQVIYKGYELDDYELNGENIVTFYAAYTDVTDPTREAYNDSESRFAIETKDTEGNVTGTTYAYSDDDMVRIRSTAITWELAPVSEEDESFKLTDPVMAEDANVLKIYTDKACTDASYLDSQTMTAEMTYYIKLPAVYAYDATGVLHELEVGNHYTVKWFKYEEDKNDWVDCKVADTTTVLTITPEFKDYQYRAEVYPKFNETISEFKNAASYGTKNDIANSVTALRAADFLRTEPTISTELKDTVTDLAITGADDEGVTMINGKEIWKLEDGTIQMHLAQFEGQTVTLEATVNTLVGDEKVPFGKVYFYRWNDDGSSELLNPTGVDVVEGVAELHNVVIDPYTSGEGYTFAHEANIDRFYAIYRANETYETSQSNWDENNDPVTPDDWNNTPNKDVLFIKSTSIMTPVIQSATEQTGKTLNEKGEVITDGAKATTYLYDLSMLQAGVPHKFALVTGAAGQNSKMEYDARNWSVVALDGREVDPANYTINWYKNVGLNDIKTAEAVSTDASIDVLENTTKQGDYFYVYLDAAGDMTKGAASKHAIIGQKQEVEGSLVHDGQIKVDGAPNGVYQLDELTITATVLPSQENATMKPTGNVAFYYSVDGETWEQVLDAEGKYVSALHEDEETHEMKASIVTTMLPVIDKTNYNQNLKLMAIYLGDESFLPSGVDKHTETKTNDAGEEVQETIQPTSTISTTNVIVYSSAVLRDAKNAENDENYMENKEVMITSGSDLLDDRSNGIMAYVDGKLGMNEEDMLLYLHDIYTRDGDDQKVDETDVDVTDDITKLVYGTDFTVQWEICRQYEAYKNGGDVEGWVSYKAAQSSGTGLICNVPLVDQNAAFRAKITIIETDKTRASFTEVNQGEHADTTLEDQDGAKIYYSNILVAERSEGTLTVNITTNDKPAGTEKLDHTEYGYIAGDKDIDSIREDNVAGIVEGETVTIHTYISGQTNTTPIAAVDVKIVDAAGETVFENPASASNNVNGYVATQWTPTEPGIYTMTVSATSTNGYGVKEITRTLIVRDNTYSFENLQLTDTYNGSVQGVEFTIEGMDDEFKALADQSVVVYYYQNGELVEPVKAGTYIAVIRLQGSAFWTEKTQVETYTIAKRPVSIVDAVVQTTVYDGDSDVNVVELILNDAVTDQSTNGTGLPKNNEGIINGDSIYAIVQSATAANADAGEQVVTIVGDKTLLGDDAANYVLTGATYTETIKVQRSQVQGDIAARVFQYSGRPITLTESDIYLIDQAGNELKMDDDYTVTYYYHSGDGVEQVDHMSAKGMYTVIASPDQKNYKGGASEIIYVRGTEDANGSDKAYKAEDDSKDLKTDFTSTLIVFENTAKVYGENSVVSAKIVDNNNANFTASIASVTYWNGTEWAPVNANMAAGRYIVKATATFDKKDADQTTDEDYAYGIYTIVKANHVLDLTAANVEYNSNQQKGYTSEVSGYKESGDIWYTWTGGAIQGVSYNAPTQAGDYVVTAHVGETDNYSAFEVSRNYSITEKELTITADSWYRKQYGAFPDATATFEGLALGTAIDSPDTSLRDVQIQPEFRFNGTTGFNNDAMDQVGTYPVDPIGALARNYAITYKTGTFSVTRENANDFLAIHGMPDNGTETENIVYYGDTIQLYAYGSQNENVINNSAFLKWEITKGTEIAKITDTGVLTIIGVGNFTVTLTRGTDTKAISTSINGVAKKQEVVIAMEPEHNVYSDTNKNYPFANITILDAMFNKIDIVQNDVLIQNYAREDVGSQTTTAKVHSKVTNYMSETYGGLHNINDKDATIKPDSQTTYYGWLEGYEHNKYTVTDAEAVSNVKVGSVADVYANLDVYNGYEILLAATENKNYNVKYITAREAGDVQVIARSLTVETGMLDQQLGMTSGSELYKSLSNELGKYDLAGWNAKGNGLSAYTTRMFGEPNWVVTFALQAMNANNHTGFVTGDSLADLVAYVDPLIDFNYGIDAHANIKWANRNDTVESRDAFIGNGEKDENDQEIKRDENYVIDGSEIKFDNYDITLENGIQNVYQRPITLRVKEGIDLHVYRGDVINSDGSVNEEVILNLLLMNLDPNNTKALVDDELIGGLAELLKHNFTDLKINVDTVLNDDKITVTITIGNLDYVLIDQANFTVTIDPTYVYAEYGKLTKTGVDVVMYVQPEEGEPYAAHVGEVTFYLYKYVEGETSYAYYMNDETPVVNKTMTMDTRTDGRYYVTFNPAVEAGTYVKIAVAEGYTIVEK